MTRDVEEHEMRLREARVAEAEAMRQADADLTEAAKQFAASPWSDAMVKQLRAAAFTYVAAMELGLGRQS